MNRASARGELVSLSVSLPPSIVCVTLGHTGRARQPETVDSGLDGGALSVSCSPNQSDVHRDKVQLYFLLCSAGGENKRDLPRSAATAAPSCDTGSGLIRQPVSFQLWSHLEACLRSRRSEQRMAEFTHLAAFVVVRNVY